MRAPVVGQQRRLAGVGDEDDVAAVAAVAAVGAGERLELLAASPTAHREAETAKAHRG